MKTRFTILLLALWTSLIMAQPPIDLTFVSWSDTHFDAVNRQDNTTLNILKTINNLADRTYPESLGGGKVGPPAFLILVGDITGDGKAQQWDSPKLPDAQSFVRAIKHLKPSIRHYEVLGNHDCPPGGPVPAKIAAKYGKTYYSFNEKGVHFIVLDPYIKGDVNKPDLNAEELKWLEKDLADLPARTPIILAMHNSPGFSGTHNMNTLGPASSKALADLLWGKNVLLILRGHTHWASSIPWNGIDSVSSGFSFSRQASPPWSANPGWTTTFLVVRIANNRLTVVDFDWEKNTWGQIWVNRKLN